MPSVNVAYRSPAMLVSRTIERGEPRFEGNPKVAAEGVSFRKAKSNLKAMIRNPKAVLESLQKATPDILSVPRLLGRNQANIGVFEVETPQGMKALKVYGSFESINVKKGGYTGIMIQKLLGDLGVMPKIHGILTPEEVTRLGERAPALKEHLGGFGHDFAVMMDKIDGFQLSRIESDSVPDTWRKSEIVDRAETIQNVLNRLNIQAIDEAWMVDRQGKLWMVDSDRCAWFNGLGKKHGFAADFGNSILHKLIRAAVFGLGITGINDISKGIASSMDRLKVTG